jgi:hypothetical protein
MRYQKTFRARYDIAQTGFNFNFADSYSEVYFCEDTRKFRVRHQYKGVVINVPLPRETAEELMHPYVQIDEHIRKYLYWSQYRSAKVWGLRYNFKECQIEYLPSAKELFDHAPKWEKIKINSLRKLLDLHPLDQKEVESLNNKMKPSNLVITRLTAREHYTRNQSGFNQTSCMVTTDDDWAYDGNKLELYEKNTEVFRHYKFEHDGVAVGFANAFWCCKHKEWILDRIYFRSSEWKAAIITAALFQKIVSGTVYDEGTVYKVVINYEPDYWPYMDTLGYYEEGSLVLSNRAPEVPEYWLLNCTGGGYRHEENQDYVYCVYSEEYIHIDDAVCIDFGSYEGSYAGSSFVFYSEINNGYCLI